MVVNRSFKQTEIGRFPTDWNIKLLPDVCSFRGGKAHEKYVSDLGTYVCVNSKFISSNGRSRKHTTENFCRAKKDDVLMVMSDLPNGKALAKTYLVEISDLYAINQRVCALTANRDTSPLFLFYVLNRNAYFLKFDDGVSQTHLLNPVFQKCPLALPPTKIEQEAIAGALSDVDIFIETLEHLLFKKRLIKLGSMQELITGTKRVPGHNKPWEIKTIGSIAPLQRGFDLPNSKLKQGQFPVAYSNGVFNHHAEWRVRGPGVTTGRSGTIGKVSYIEEDFWPHNTALWVTSFKENYPKFIYYLFSHIGFEQFATGSGVPTLNRNDAHSFEIEIPSDVKEQIAIASILSTMDADIGNLETKLIKARLIKQGMMQELLTGRVRLI